jgi:2-methylfumaryl-CoA isomerase
MFGVLNGMRVIEGASFVAAPSCALYLAQLGAEVIRFDMIGGGPDRYRWPIEPGGASLYWEGLNKGKKSIAIDLSQPDGRELAAQLVTASGSGAGLFVTNFPADGFLSHQRLASRRADLITLRVMGWPSGETALDYTVNAAIGFPLMTGTPDAVSPTNHVLPAWDLVTGAYGAFALLAAERHRRKTGHGQEVRVPLSDIAIATIGSLGQIAEVSINDTDRPRLGNDLYGAFGRDFRCADGRFVMIVAITTRQWSDLVKSLNLEAEIAQLEQSVGVSFSVDETMRFKHRDALFSLVQSRVERLTLAELENHFSGTGVCWDRYQSVLDAVKNDPRLTDNPLLSTVRQPSGLSYKVPGAPAQFSALPRVAAVRAPQLGEHTNEILSTVLGLGESQIARLHDSRVVAESARRN